MIKWLPLVSAFTVLLLSCERVIDVTPREQEPKMVVEATIETDEYPVVYLTRSFNFFNQLTPDKFIGAFVRNAVITISNGTQTHTLKEYEVPLVEGYFLYYYGIDSANLSTAFKGENGKSYTLNVSAEGENYNANTTIPDLAKTIESLYYEKANDKEDTNKVILYGKFNDPVGLGNYTRYFTKTNDEPYLAGLNSVSDDKVVDGKSYSVQIDRGADRNSEIDFEEYAFFHRGDAITVKYCNIDKAVYDFWRTMEYSYSSIGNPFSSPTKVLGNISNGALGYFGGYAVQYSSIIIPE